MSVSAMQLPSALVVFFLIFTRVSSALVAAPIFTEKALPVMMKVGLSGVIALLLAPAQMKLVTPIHPDVVSFVILVGMQVLLGLAFALIFTVVFRAAAAAGELIGEQMGVTLAGWVRPNADGEMHTIAELYNIIAALIFLGLDGMHWVLLALGSSLNTMPVTKVDLTPGLLALLLPLGGVAVMFAIGLALPLIVTLLLADVITGLLGRAMPSLNMFVLGLPLKVALGVGGLLIAAPFTISLLMQFFRQLPDMVLLK